MGPGVFGAGVTQLNLLISTALASLLPDRLGRRISITPTG